MEAGTAGRWKVRKSLRGRWWYAVNPERARFIVCASWQRAMEVAHREYHA